MSKGVIAILSIFSFVIPWSLFAPWIGIFGYCVFVGLAPQWTWRFDIPDIDFQKFIAGGTLVGFFLSGKAFNLGSKTAIVSAFALLAYFGLVLFSYNNSEDQVRSLDFLDPTWKICLMWLLALLVVIEERHLEIIVWCLIVCHAWLAFEINVQYFSNGYVLVNEFRWNGLDSNTYSIMTVPVMALSLSLALFSEKMFWRGLAFGVLLLQVHQLMILQSRGTMMGGIVTLLVAIWFMPKTRLNLGILLCGLCIGSAMAGPSVVEEFMSSFNQENALDSSAESRFKLWKAGLAIMVDYPFFGLGPWIGERYVPAYYEGDLGGVSRKALHNLFFEIGTGSGVFACIAILVFYFTPVVAHWRVIRSVYFVQQSYVFKSVSLSCISGVLGFWGASMFSSGALLETPFLLVGFSCIAFRFFRFRDNGQEGEAIDSEME
jgi:O-antigen ligase